MVARTTQFATIASGDTCSSAFALGGTRAMLFLPALTSCSITLQAAAVTNPSSADFMPIHNPAGSGPFIAYPGAGGVALPLDVAMVAVAARVCFSVVQGANRSFQIVAER